MRPRPGPAARARLADARVQAAILQVKAMRHILDAGRRVMKSPEPSLEAAEALLAQLQVVGRVFDAAEARLTPASPSITRRTRRLRQAEDGARNGARDGAR